MLVEFAAGPEDQMEKFFNIYDWILEEGETYLTKDHPRLLKTDGMHNCDSIASIYLLDVMGFKRSKLNLPEEYPSPYFFYQIMYRHKHRMYVRSELEDYLKVWIHR